MVRADDAPAILAMVHGSLGVGERITLADRGLGVWEVHDAGGVDLATLSIVSRERAMDLLTGAGFTPDPPAGTEAGRPGIRCLQAVRERSLPDTVGPDLRLLVCGLNPSLHAADAGVGFVTGSNRFWRAAVEAGLVSRERDPWHALREHGVGMTDLVKRATARADALTRAEYRDGVARLGRLCSWLQPAAVCMVGLAGWRAAVDPKALPGWQAEGLGGRPVYVMPSTSGLNAGSSFAALVDHLRAARLGT